MEQINDQTLDKFLKKIYAFYASQNYKENNNKHVNLLWEQKVFFLNNKNYVPESKEMANCVVFKFPTYFPK